MHGWVIVVVVATERQAYFVSYALCRVVRLCVSAHVEVSLERHASDSNQLVAKINTFLIYKQKKQANKQKTRILLSFRLLESSQTARNQSVCSLLRWPTNGLLPSPEFQPKGVGNDPDERNTKIE